MGEVTVEGGAPDEPVDLSGPDSGVVRGGEKRIEFGEGGDASMEVEQEPPVADPARRGRGGLQFPLGETHIDKMVDHLVDRFLRRGQQGGVHRFPPGFRGPCDRSDGGGENEKRDENAPPGMRIVRRTAETEGGGLHFFNSAGRGAAPQLTRMRTASWRFRPGHGADGRIPRPRYRARRRACCRRN
jgi:hypothetical protein